VATADKEMAPAAEHEPAVAYEPLPSETAAGDEAMDDEAMAIAAMPAGASEPRVDSAAHQQQAAARPAPAGTPDKPFVAPPPTAVAASWLGGIDVQHDAHGTVVRVEGDGQFDYSTFALDNPHRFVIDLAGVVKGTDLSAVPVGGIVERVRMAQFRSEPQAVSRVVFDLAYPIVPRIERTANALVVRFGELNGNRPPGYAALETRATVPPAADPAGSMRLAQSEPAPMPAEAPQTPPMEAEESPPVAQPAMPERTMPEEAMQDEGMAEEMPQTQAPESMPRSMPQPMDRPSMQEPMAPAPRNGDDRRTSDLDLYGGGGVEISTPQSPVDAFATRTLSGEERQFVGERYDFSLRDADLVETLRSFAVMSGLNIVIQPGISGTVTVELRDVPWDQAFEQILKINGLSYEVEGNIMRIAPTQLLSREAAQRRALEAAKALSVPLTTVIRRLSYSQATAVSNILRSNGGILSERGSVIVDQRTNTLIIKELPDYINTVIAVIENLDIPEPLVMIEARIVETRKNFSRTLGINWGFNGVSSASTGNTTGLVFPNQGTVDGGVNLLTGGSNGFLDVTLGNVLNTFNLDIALQAAENEGLVNILSAPKVQALNNEQASIQSGFQIPIQTVANNTVSVQFVNATLRLEVTPQVTAEGTVLMDINIQKRNPEFGLTVAGAANAPISTKEARTRVIVRDGGTTVIGGIYEVTTNQGEDRVPGLANVPIIGHLFKNKRRTDENSELLIFITPRVVKL